MYFCFFAAFRFVLIIVCRRGCLCPGSGAYYGRQQGMCAGQTMTLANATPYGGTWVSNNAAAVVQSSTASSATIRGNGVGVSVITFTTTSDGCAATRTVTVNACRTSGDNNPLAEIEPARTRDLHLYPNPNNGSFTLKGNLGGQHDGSAQVTIMNVTGQIVYSSMLAITQGHIDSAIRMDNGLPAGVYMLSVRGSDDRRVFRFVVK